ncbi:hypothetical protein LY28_03519 [Ruminiclostridium sufflavum DSM 19573]|uniref:Uncharacterized protein n=1 Tax=Ruminiclostridium sufflavum DSM 19573 TaxID=1121337 RepID=A0A318Y1J1_9FIRM|nr:hypothetical protein [Ruminiclostridium sufflavum]PYG84898.1 hypothetical protein LY28_03519 [Ruminiclostridium sufflavum DSM 19573]
MGYCGNCMEFEENSEGDYRCMKLNIPCKAGQKTCMYFNKKSGGKAEERPAIKSQYEKSK